MIVINNLPLSLIFWGCWKNTFISNLLKKNFITSYKCIWIHVKRIITIILDSLANLFWNGWLIDPQSVRNSLQRVTKFESIFQFIHAYVYMTVQRRTQLQKKATNFASIRFRSTKLGCTLYHMAGARRIDEYSTSSLVMDFVK